MMYINEDKLLMGMIQSIIRSTKWLLLQYILLFFLPYLWGNNLNGGVVLCIGIYTFLYGICWECIPKNKRLSYLPIPYAGYVLLAVLGSIVTGLFFPSIIVILTLPLYGLSCYLFVKLLKKNLRKDRNSILKRIFLYAICFLVLFGIESSRISWLCHNHGTIKSEKEEVLQRRDYLTEKLIRSPKAVLGEMPSSIGSQFQGEWALYSCSMFTAALSNISRIYPDTQKENVQLMDSLIQIVLSPELRKYDTDRWKEDALESLDGNKSHVSYLSHLAWMICEYKRSGGNSHYDELLHSICSTMNRRIRQHIAFNLPTYPDESIYVPDMLVAILALKQYSDIFDGKYSSAVRTWVKRARNEWCDKETGLLVSFLDELGSQIEGAPVKGSYSALNTSYLTYIDENFAREQYEKFKIYFWKDGMISGFKEYYQYPCPIGFDIDAGPIILGLSPSGTAFAMGAVTYFNDVILRTEILRTAEKAGRTVLWDGKRHYALANIALVGEAIMLAMRTHYSM